jgi:hypothetical protein
MLPLHEYWSSLFEIDDALLRSLDPITFHTVGVEARVLVLILGAPPEYWFSEVPRDRAKLSQDEEAPSEDDSWVPWSSPPLPHSNFHHPYLPGAHFFVDERELDHAVNAGLAFWRSGGCPGGSWRAAAGWF